MMNWKKMKKYNINFLILFKTLYNINIKLSYLR